MKLYLLATKKLFPSPIVALLGLFLLFSAVPSNFALTSFSNAEASFFSNDLELFEEVIGLVGDRYVYTPDYKKIFIGSIDEMISALTDKNISLENILNKKEVFLTQSTKGILPIIKIDDKVIGEGKPGKNTLTLRSIL